jgi:hypothetical protein
MRIRINITDAKFELVLNPSAQSKCIEGDAEVSRTYSALTLEQLQRLYANTTGFSLEATDYNTAIQTCKFIAIRLLTAKGGYAYDLEKQEDAG